jgi:hypothetical protein
VLLFIIVFAATRRGSSSDAAHGGRGSSANAIATGHQGGGSAGDGDDDSSSTPMKLPSHGGATGTATPAVAAAGSADVPAGSADTGSDSGSAAVATAEPAKEPPSVEAPKHHPTLGGKQVVLEYDTPTHEAPKAAPAPKEESAAIARARMAYASGNQKLFAGDAAGAVRFYQQSLGFYPGYVAGYRGLGLAYSQQGDKAKALQAFRTYLSSVPGAKDAPLIRKREAMLSH